MVNIVFFIIGIAFLVLWFFIGGIINIACGIAMIALGIKGIKYRTKARASIDTKVTVRNEKLELINSAVDLGNPEIIPITLTVDQTAVKAFCQNEYLGRVDCEFCPDLPKLVKKRRIASAVMDVSCPMQNDQWEHVFSVHIETM